MKKYLSWLSLALLMTLGAVGCKDGMSTIGESILPPNYPVKAVMDSVTVDYQTVSYPQIYTNSNITLLGQINDPVYGNFKGNFITRLRGAAGFKFANKPVNGKIDSVQLWLNYSAFAGDSAALMKVAVYKVTESLTNGNYSQTDLDKYLNELNFMGAASYTPNHGLLDTIRRTRYIGVNLNKAVGQKIYDASLNHPEYFETDEAFAKNILPGLLVTNTTGSGNVLSVYGVELRIFYTYERITPGPDDKKTAVGTEVFVNTKEQILVNGFANNDISGLLAPNKDFCFVKSPAGVVPKITISKELLVKAFEKHKVKSDKGIEWLLNEAQFSLPVEQPNVAETKLGPPANMMLIALDSVKPFFTKNLTELDMPDAAFISSGYSIESRYYNFSNISMLISKHLKEHSKLDGSGKLVVDKDLEALLIPVQRFMVNDLYGRPQPSEVSNYLFPSGAKLNISKNAKKLYIISTERVVEGANGTN